jgi:hypothetical protein
LQTASASRLVPAAGPLANILFGLAALALLRFLTTQQNANARAQTGVSANTTAAAPAAFGVTRISLTLLFLYFFAFANLFLATGYILYSGLINFGDFAAVIDGLRPAWLYRAALVMIGALGYRYGIAQAARCLAQLLARAHTPPASGTAASPLPASPLSSEQQSSPPAPPLPSAQQSPSLPAAPISLPAARRIIRTACFAGGALFFLSSFLNPISPSLILYDGLSGAIGLTLGFFLALTDLRQSAAKSSTSAPQGSVPQPLAAEIEIPLNLALTITAAIFAAAFLIFMGKGIRLP